MNPHHFDIVVLGSGLVGSSFVLALTNTNSVSQYNIAIIDKQAVIDKQALHAQSISSQKFENNARAIALSHYSVESLKSLGLWSELESDATPISKVQVSSQGHFGVTHLQAKDHHLTSLGCVVDADRLNGALNLAVNQRRAVTQFRSDEIIRCSWQENRWQVTLASGKELLCHVLVGADGSESYLRKRCGVELRIKDYQQQALVSNLFLSTEHHNIAYERFLNQDSNLSSLALLPFGKHRMKSILIAEQNEAQRLLAHSEKDYLHLLQNLFGFRLGKFKGLGQRFGYPLKQISAETVYGPGWVLIGNAANTLHPVAAQGFNLGLRDAMTLANELKYNHSLSEATILNRYYLKRRKDHFQTRVLTDTLVNKKSVLPFGILCNEFLPFVKNKMMSQCLGMAATL